MPATDITAIKITFNEKNFEYDVYSLIKEFYPKAEITMDYTLSWEEEIKKESEGSSPEVSESSGQKEIETDQNSENSKVCKPERTRKTADEQNVQEIRLYAEVNYGPEQISFTLSDSEHALLLDRQVSVAADTDRIRTKNIVKRLVYDAFVDFTGQKMPWGDLTGIRPTKIPMHLLEEGWRNPDIAKYMRDTYAVSPEKTALAITIANREKDLLSRLDYEHGYSLYIGIPFCPSICLYCSFGSHILERYKDKVDLYLDTLIKELTFISEQMAGWHLDTIYIGGGTPTTLNPAQMDRLLCNVQKLFDLEGVKEFTVEAGRPDTITRDVLAVIRKYPVSRISINPQTMNQKTLDLIGRKHTVEDIVEKFHIARELGFDNINMDLIIGLPGEEKEEVAHTLEQIEALNPDSLTVHSLALKRATRLNLFKDQYREISFENSSEIMQMTMDSAHRMMMGPYYMYRQKNMAGNFENVGYSRDGKAGLYNILIMEEKQTILAAGSGASTKFVFEHGSRIERVENVKDLKNYIERIDEMLERKRIGIEKYLGK